MIESILTFFAFGTLGFWLLIGVASILITSAIECDHYGWPTFIASVLGITYWKSFYELGFDWRAVGIGVTAYLVIGIVWSMFRWFKYVQKELSEYNTGNTSFSDGFIERSVSVPNNNKGRIIAWIIYWPWSFAWHITGDFFTMLYNGLEGWYIQIANRAIEKAKENNTKSKKK